MSDLGDVLENTEQLYDAVPLLQPDAIRVIDLIRFDAAAGTLCYTMRAVPLTSIAYYALSYTWMLADIVPTQPPVRPDPLEIECNGLRVPVGPNLFDALFKLAQALSKKDSEENYPSAFWIDALCINQDNVEERNAQVQMMGQVYSRAIGVIVWLGLSDQASEVALPIIHVFSEALARMRYRSLGLRRKYRFNDPRFYLDANMAPISVEEWKQVRRFLSRPWFRRVWIVQEVAMARGVVFMCGDITIMWTDLSIVSLFLVAEGWTLYQAREGAPGTGRAHTYGAESLTLMLEARKSTYESITDHLTREDLFIFLQELYNFDDEEGFLVTKFAWLVQSGRAREATDARDRVFAISNLVSELQQSQHWHAIAADYRRSTAEVFSTLTKHVIEKLGNLNMLSFVGREEADELMDLPSWTPDFSIFQQPQPLIMMHEYPVLRAWQKKIPLSTNSINLHSLEVQGFMMEKVKECGIDIWKAIHSKFADLIVMAYDGHSQNDATWLETLIKTLVAGHSYYHSGSQEDTKHEFINFVLGMISTEILNSALTAENLEAFRSQTATWWDLNRRFEDICTADPDLPSRKQFEDRVEQDLDMWIKLAAAGKFDRDHVLDDEEFNKKALESTGPFSRRIEGHMVGRKLIRTATKSLLGMTCVSAEPEDEIWLLIGAKIPYLLRPKDVDGTVYTFVGEVYVDEFTDERIAKYINIDESQTLIIE